MTTSPLFYIFVILVALWTIPWKIYAAWTAAKHGHKVWFAVLVLLNTCAILEIIYIFYVAKKTWVEVKRDFSRAFSFMK